MKLSTLFVAISALALTTSALADFNRTGDQGTVAVSYVQVNAPNTSSWQGADLTAVVPLGKTDAVRWNADVQSQFVQTHGLNSDGQNVSTIGVGLTPWMHFQASPDVSFDPYLRLGVQGNSGNFFAVNHHYTAYAVEPGVVGKLGDIYALAAYQYGEGFNSDYGSVVSMPKVGLGINLTKNLAVEGRYEMNRGSYSFDRTVVGLTYKF